MGRETTTTFRIAGREDRGRVLLETSELRFRGRTSFRIGFEETRNVRVSGGALALEAPPGHIEIDLGAAAERWADAILHPKSRLAKLGVKAGLTCAVLGVADPEFVAEVAAATGAACRAQVGAATDIVFVGVKVRSDLAKLHRVRARMRDDAAVWIVHPKGKDAAVPDSEVRRAIIAAGLVDVKIAAFSTTMTSTKAVIPRAARGAH